MSREHIHTVYDRMAAKKVFSSNPANAGATDPQTGEAIYEGPVEFPKMIYHPQGKVRIMTPASPGQKEQTEIINRIVKNHKEYSEYKSAGWHDHPADAFNAGLTPEQRAMGIAAPPKTASTRISELESTIKRLEAELKAGRSGPVQDDTREEDLPPEPLPGSDPDAPEPEPEE